MANMPDTNKRQVAIRLEIELCRKVEKEFSRFGDNGKTIAYIRALEEATRNVLLTSEDYEMIAAEQKANERKRGV